MKWIAFFSQTGSEIVELSKAIGKKPDLLVTNNFEDKISFHPGIRELKVIIQSARHEHLMLYFENQRLFKPENTLITLHGYLKIIPKQVVELYPHAYNGHPGAIDLYPELKGKDPQIKAWESKYPIVGSVVHKVTSEVDEGEIVKSVHYTNRTESLNEMYGLLKQSSLESWVYFMKGFYANRD